MHVLWCLYICKYAHKCTCSAEEEGDREEEEGEGEGEGEGHGGEEDFEIPQVVSFGMEGGSSQSRGGGVEREEEEEGGLLEEDREGRSRSNSESSSLYGQLLCVYMVTYVHMYICSLPPSIL